MKKLLLYLFITFAAILPVSAADNPDHVTFDFSKANWTNNQLGNIGSAATDPNGNTFYIQISIQTGDGANSPDLISGQYLQWFQKNTLLVRNSGEYAQKITKIELITDAPANYQVKGLESNTGNITALGTTGIWEGSAEIVTLRNTGTNNHARIKQINVYYNNSASAIPTVMTDDHNNSDTAYDSEMHFYYLNGTETPAGTTPPPGIYIRRRGSTTEKIVIR